MVEIGLFNDNDVEPTERFTVSLSSNSRAILGEPSSVYIQDDDGVYCINRTKSTFIVVAVVVLFVMACQL